MDKTILLIFGMVLLILIIYIIALIRKPRLPDKTDTYDIPQNSTSVQSSQPANNDEPQLTNHAAMRMQERLGIYGTEQQTKRMNDAFKYGRTADRTNGDIRIKLESAEMKYDEETIAKYYGNSIFIFTAEDNVLKTVYPFDNNSNKYYWH